MLFTTLSTSTARDHSLAKCSITIRSSTYSLTTGRGQNAIPPKTHLFVDPGAPGTTF